MAGGRKNHEQGGRTEEVLRDYFLDAGYFVVRGPRLVFMNDDITDVDLWLYARALRATRERTIVDCRDRANAKALERILWIKGLQVVLRVERAAVATTASRGSLRSFGELQGVMVLDGNFVAAAKDRAATKLRLTEDEFLAATTGQGRDPLFAADKRRYDQAKSRVLTSLDFDGANLAMAEVAHFAQSVMSGGNPQPSCRMLYMMLALFCVSLDFAAQFTAFDSVEARRTLILEGLRYGSGGAVKVDQAINMATMLVRAYAPDLRTQFARATKKVSEDLDGVPVPILAEFFARHEVFGSLFDVALVLERAAFSREFVSPEHLDRRALSALMVVLDFAGISRADFVRRASARPGHVGVRD